MNNSSLLLLLMTMRTGVFCKCFTWKPVDDNQIYIRCSITDETSYIEIYDENQNHYARCSNLTCNTTGGNAAINIDNTEMTYQVQIENDYHDYENDWTCRYTNNSLQMKVSTLKGFIEQTEVFLEIIQESKNTFSLKCWTCHETVGSFAEFLVNSITEDNLRFSDDICYHTKGKCNKQVCCCSTYIYKWIYIAPHSSDNINFTCRVGFKDDGRKCKSSQNTTAVKTTGEKAFEIYHSDPMLRPPCSRIQYNTSSSGPIESTKAPETALETDNTSTAMYFLCVSLLVLCSVFLAFHCRERLKRSVNKLSCCTTDTRNEAYEMANTDPPSQ